MFDAAIFDVDGVLTPTAAIHERAWKEALDRALESHGGARAFSHEDYLDHVDGKPRLDGLRDFFLSRNLELGDDELTTIAEAKSRAFRRLLDERGAPAFEDALDEIERFRAHGVMLAFVSSSRNARRVLDMAGLDEACNVLVDGVVAGSEHLRDKTDIFRHALRLLDADPPNVVAVEDSVSGVAAAAGVGCGLVVGLARDPARRAALLAGGAGRVIADLRALDSLLEPGSRASATLPRALSLAELEHRIAGRRVALFLDFDGTLAPIVPHPDDARIDPRIRARLEAIARHCPVAIISGRDRADVARRVAIECVWYAGSHGIDLAGPNGETFVVPAAREALTELERTEEVARHRLAALEGIVIERKTFGLAVHYRLADRAATEQALRVIRDLSLHAPRLSAIAGERVVELVPDLDWHKGRAVEHVASALGHVFPIYLGDGHTDEDAFRALRHRGMGILVGGARRPSHADYRLEDIEGVVRFLDLLERRLRAPVTSPEWVLEFDRWSPRLESLREAICTLGNGRVATRGAAEEATADDVHYPGTYLAGGYDRCASEIEGQVLVHEDLVNWPNWLGLSFRPVAGEWLSLDRWEVLSYEQALDVRLGTLRRRLRVRDEDGRETALTTARIVSMADPHVAAISWELVPLNWSGRLQLRSSLDGSVRNEGVARYRGLRGQHLVPDGVGSTVDTTWLVARTRQSRIRLAEVARVRLREPHAIDSRRTEEHVDRVDELVELPATAGTPVRLEKVVVLSSSRDRAISEPLADAKARMASLPGFEELATAHARRWTELWDRFDIQLGNSHPEANRLLRLHVFHLLQIASPHVVERDVSVPARGLHGEAYRGHIFWDELFVFPFLTYAMPELTRELLTYRYRRLDAARANARRLGLQGAAYPWQSGSDGREVSAVMHENPLSGRWSVDESHLQRHIGAAVAYNVWQYHDTTGDLPFLLSYGAEMLIEIARFWASLAKWDQVLGRYRIRGVVGPDEFHTRYPGTSAPGIDDNAYTNVMAAWCLRIAERALREIDDDRCRELLDRLGVTDEERLHWRDVAARLRIVFLEGGIIAQFDGYEALAELDWSAYRKRYGNVQRLDRILASEGDSPARYKASKQADVLMLFYLFSADELVRLFDEMGYSFDPATIPLNVDYYLSRTSHGSTLSRVVHAWVLARSDRPRSFELFTEALRSDVADVQGGTTSEGVHLGAMAGTVDIVKRGYTGAVVRDGVLWFEPALPDDLSEVKTQFLVRGAWLDVAITHDALEVELVRGAAIARVGVDADIHHLARGVRQRFPMKAPKESRPGATESRRRLERLAR